MSLVAFQPSGFYLQGFQEASSPVDTHDGGHWSERDYKRYRRKLELLAKSGERFTQSKYIKEATKVLKIVEALPVETPIIQKIAFNQEEIEQKYFDQINQELNRVINYLDAALHQREELRLEQEDEETLLRLL